MRLMPDEDWPKIRFFKPHEWGSWRNVSAVLIYVVDELRASAHAACIIHCAWATSGHSAGSAHYRGLAVDLHLVGMPVIDQYLLAEKLGEFGGIGLYPHWNTPGLHLDMAEKGRRWIRDAKGIYLPLTWQNIKRNCP